MTVLDEIWKRMRGDVLFCKLCVFVPIPSTVEKENSVTDSQDRKKKGGLTTVSYLCVVISLIM